jgi:hypothetical protein
VERKGHDLNGQRAFHADVPYSLLQSIRLVHALTESGHRLHIRSEHQDRFSRLAEVFGIHYAVGIDGIPELPALRVDHRTPRTVIGTIERPLIFPHAIVDRCRMMWALRRDIRFSFAGLLTESRREVLGNWLKGIDARAQLVLTDASPSVIRALAGAPRRLLDRLRKKSLTVDTGEIVFWSSQRGRHFPIKSWDEEYYRLLGRSQFVLCPRGDCVWTYRFFEAALCGALPVIEATCEAYAGFRYKTMAEPARDMEWRREDAEHNYERCRERLTVPEQLLSEEVAALLVGGTR